MQSTPTAGGDATDPACESGGLGEGDMTDASDADNVQDENGTDDAAEGDTEAGTRDQGDDAADAATPGQLIEGQDLLPRATITVEQAVAIAIGAAQGTLGSVDLKASEGVLVFEVTIGDNEVAVNAADGTVVSVQTQDDDEQDNGCDNEAQVAPDTLDNGKELLSQATITVEQAITAAQGAATGTLGEVDLDVRNGTLVFTVGIGDQDVHVDAATGAVIDITSGEE